MYHIGLIPDLAFSIWMQGSQKNEAPPKTYKCQHKGITKIKKVMQPQFPIITTIYDLDGVPILCCWKFEKNDTIFFLNSAPKVDKICLLLNVYSKFFPIFSKN